nr:hypothetical protein [Listeria aquatica]
MEIIKISPRGYCYGVVDAMVIAKNASLDPNLPRPIHILGMIVHNKHVTDAFEEIGIHTLMGKTERKFLNKLILVPSFLRRMVFHHGLKNLQKKKGL